MKIVLENIFLYFGAVVCLLSSLGILVMRGVYDKLHYVAPMSTVGAAAITIALLIREGLTVTTGKGVLLALLLGLSSAVLTQATARALEVRSSRLAGDEEREECL